MSHQRPAEGKVMFSVVLENERELVLRNATGGEERRLVLSDTTLMTHGVMAVAADLMTSVGYDMKDEQGQEDTRR